MTDKTKLKRVSETSELEIQFKLSLLDDTVVERTEEDEVFVFQVGDGQFLAKLDELLVGLEEGTRAKFTLMPEDAFGQPDPMNFQTMKKTDFPEGMQLTEGHVIGFNTPTGDEIPATVYQIKEDEVVMDFNHPLAGQPLIFDVTIVKVLS
ncbi:peptidylprolyl isomerase [Hydrogenovibrio sp. JE_KL2]|uniref:FKBP-type peptidyl-prolyl cis-trans isomerase n=1 Tax=Hydrogenovibrio sp. JE_KL2 TaxID=2651188 RepID=UPI00128B12C0|nr:FKBP-type peptidyl-prolyl cis-trans isomerase [Hydrogenovibrio sp. JE_KL2]MPQ76209.1 peptidylprolyl isomerase [Hydrogenovibrio sp. JE_KL2]